MSIVVGNMIGSGIFLLPASLALYGGIGIVGWICASIGALLLAVVFGNLSQYSPNTIGGPYVFTRMGLGDFPAFLVAWGYWISIWTTNAAIAVALVGYLTIFIPALGESALFSVATGLGFIWLFSWINFKPIKTVASVQLITTILKVVPLLLMGFIGLWFVEWNHFIPFNQSEESNFSAITSTTVLTLFAFLGLESAGIVSKETDNASITVKKATIGGTLLTVIIYITSTIAVMGLIPPETLASSSAPFAEAAEKFLGPSGRYIIAGCAVIATMGALNGWLLMQGRIPMAAARDKLFPSVFKKENIHGAPVSGIIISSLLASALMLLNFSKSLVDTFTFMITLSTLCCLIPYLFSTASYAILIFNRHQYPNPKLLILSLFAFIFCIWIIFGCGAEIVFYGFLLLMASVPFYVMLRPKEKIIEDE